MRIGVLGINHKSSELSIRECIAKAALSLFAGHGGSSSFPLVLLPTCNRTEVYFSGENLAHTQSILLNQLREKVLFPFEHHIYSYFGVDCFAHLATVTAGLDSAILFETDIQRQVKIAYENACLYEDLPKELHFLFQKCLKIGKAIRSSFPRSESYENLEKMIFHLTECYFREIESLKILFIGNSEINRKILSFFYCKLLRNIHLCTRSKNVLEGELQHQIREVFGWEKLNDWKHYDLIICGSNARDYLIQASYETSKIKRAHLILDLAVPRNVDPELGRHPNIQLLNIDELTNLIRQDQTRYEEEIQRCLEGIRKEAGRQLSLFIERQKMGRSLQPSLLT